MNMKKIINILLFVAMICSFGWFVIFTPTNDLLLLASMFMFFVCAMAWIAFSKMGEKATDFMDKITNED